MILDRNVLATLKVALWGAQKGEEGLDAIISPSIPGLTL